MAPADSEDRHVATEGFPCERQLEVVAPSVDPPELRVGGLAVEDWVDVHAAGQQHAVQPFEEGRDVSGGDRGQYDRHGDFDTPSLVECWQTAPYMHDGKYTTVKQLIAEGKHGAKGGDIGSLSPQQLDDLVEFVLSL